MCENNVGSKQHLRKTIKHELIHAYDHMHGLLSKQPLDFSDCNLLACTEIRAAVLSGDCDYTAEVSEARYFHWLYRMVALGWLGVLVVYD